jgi:hypothetical protein
VRGAGVYAESGASFGDATRASAQPMHQRQHDDPPREQPRPGHGDRSSDPPPQPRYVGRTVPSALSPRAASFRTIGSVSDERSQETVASGVAEALRRRASDWAAGAEECRELDRRIARRQSPQERLDSGRELVELAAKLRQRD